MRMMLISAGIIGKVKAFDKDVALFDQYVQAGSDNHER